MPDDLPASNQLLINTTQAVFGLIGLALLWNEWRNRHHHRPALVKWTVSPLQFIQSALCVVLGGVVLHTVLIQTLGDQSDVLWNLLVPGGAFSVGLIVGALVAALGLPAAPRQDASLPRATLLGAKAFLIIIAVALASSFLWRVVLKILGIDAPQQELIDHFVRADSPGPLLALSFVAIILAPVAEEIVFRAGLFRYLLGRVPRWIALVLPAVIFAALHDNLASFFPLVVLGVFFALAYERTGRLIVPIVAHALFNLNTILVVLNGGGE